MTAFVRPGYVCAERERELLARSSLPKWNPSPERSQPNTSPHRPTVPLGVVPSSSSFGSRSSSPTTQKFGSLEKPAGIQKSEQIRGVKTAEHHKEKTIPDNVRQFVLKHYAEAQKLADSLGNGVTAAEVLAVAGNETFWGKLDTHAKFGNFFGLHGHGPDGTYYTTGNHTPVAKFPVNNGFLLSGQEFVKRLQNRKLMTSGLGDNPKAFFDVLNKSGLYAAESHGTYSDFMVRKDEKTWGPYTFVVECINRLRQEGLL